MLKPLLAAISILFTSRLLLTAAWNLFFHPLRHLPGPTLWIAFPFLRHLAAIRGLLDKRMRHFHQKYGEVVRFTPHEVSFITAQAWKDIYGHGHRQLPKALHSRSNTLDILSANDADHGRFRKSLSHAFSAKGLQAQEPILTAYVDKLVERLKGVADSNMPADMARWYNLATFDLIGDLAFGEPFGGLESSAYHHWISAIFDFVRVIPFIRAKDNYPLLVSLFLAFLPGGFLEAQKKQKEHAHLTVQKRLDNTALHGRDDFMDSMLRHRGKDNGLSDDELVANANILIIAGSETTATLLSGVTYWLLRRPEILEKVTSEVRSNLDSEADITIQTVSTKLPYMLACITEGLRLYPPVPTGLQRVTLPSTTATRISGYDLPPNTRVSVHQSAAYWSAINFHNPKLFAPERWLPETKDDPTSPFYHDNRDVLQPFSTGPRNCIGVNLAHSEMRLILARVLWNFDLALCDESSDWDDQKAFVFWEKNPLLCSLTLARRQSSKG